MSELSTLTVGNFQTASAVAAAFSSQNKIVKTNNTLNIAFYMLLGDLHKMSTKNCHFEQK